MNVEDLLKLHRDRQVIFSLDNKELHYGFLDSINPNDSTATIIPDEHRDMICQVPLSEVYEGFNLFE